MKNKGFTLIEILASIVIMSVVLLIGLTGYGKVKEQINQKEYENKVKYIETQAAKYASETGYLQTTVQELINKGYLEAETKDGKITNPINGANLNDNVINITKRRNNYYGNLTDTTSGIDDLNKVNENLEIIMTTKESNRNIQSGEWTNENVILQARIKEGNAKNRTMDEVEKIVWVDPLANLTEANSYEVTASNQNIVKATYEVEVYFSDATIYQATALVRIDKQQPNIDPNSIMIDGTRKDYNQKATKYDKTVSIMASDQNGSGIKKYYIGTNGDYRQNKEYDEKTREDGLELKDPLTNIKLKKDNGIYYVWVEDKAGNVSERESFEVKNVDKIAPTCEIKADGEKGENEWFRGDVKFTIEAKDNEGGSGVRSAETGGITELKEDKKSYEVKGFATDKAGNKGECRIEVKRDTTPPSCTWSGESTNWTKENRTITTTCSDETSGCVQEKYEAKYTSGTHKAEEISYELKDQAGNTKECKKTAQIYIDKEPPTCSIDLISGISGQNNWYISDVSYRINGSDSGSGLATPIPNDIRTISNEGHHPINISLIDKVGNYTSCGQDIKIDKTAPTCKFSGASKDWSNASSRTIKVCDDIVSGCDSNYDEIVSVDAGEALKTTSISKWIYDNAGNSNYCSDDDVDIYLDRIAPECNGWSGENSSWTNSSVTVKAKCKDSDSGCSAVTGTTVSGGVEVTTQSVSNTIKDKAGNTKTCSKNSAKFYYDGVAPYTPYFDTNATVLIDGVNVVQSVYGNCDASCVSSQSSGVNGGAVNSANLQKAEDKCFVNRKCDNNGANKTIAINCRVNKQRYCGDYKISANNTSGGSPITISTTTNKKECADTGYPARIHFKYQAVDKAGNKSKFLTVSVINSFAYNNQNIKGYYSATNDKKEELYYWKPSAKEDVICAQQSSN